jgi:methyl-accepting chemotaxis protein
VKTNLLPKNKNDMKNNQKPNHMKYSIRTRFVLGMIFLFVIILVLSVFSGYYMNKLSNKTSAILKENYLSVVYAREMMEGITNINKEITTSFLRKSKPDSTLIANYIYSVNHSLDLEKKNITEPGEFKLVAEIEAGYYQYKDSVSKMSNSPDADGLLYLENESGDLFRQLLILSDMNGKALEAKTDDAKASSRKAMTNMSLLASIAFLIGLSFSYSFASYFNRRFLQLFNGIKELESSNFKEHLYVEGNDEFSEISLVINDMADKLQVQRQKISGNLQPEPHKGISSSDIDELQKMLFRLKTIEEQATVLLSKIEKK